MPVAGDHITSVTPGDQGHGHFLLFLVISPQAALSGRSHRESHRCTGREAAPPEQILAATGITPLTGRAYCPAPWPVARLIAPPSVLMCPNRGAMALPQLKIRRHDRGTRALIILEGEIDLATVPLVREALAECLRDGVRGIDVDLAAVLFCDVSGLNAFLSASRLATVAGRTLRLHHPSPSMVRIIEITGSGFLLHSFHAAEVRVRRTPAVAGDAP